MPSGAKHRGTTWRERVYMCGSPLVIYEDNHLLVLSKPGRMPCVPDSSRDVSLLDWGRAYIKKTRAKPGNVFLGVVHRLDRPVSGIVCLALTSKAAARLSEQIRLRKARKTYVAVTAGQPSCDRLTLTNVIRKNRRANRVDVFPASQTSRGKMAITELRLLAQKGGLSLLELHPVTGRAHQLRAQCAHHGLPLVGDVKYGGPPNPMKDRSVALHALSLEIKHPTKPRYVHFSCPPVKNMVWRPFIGDIPRISHVEIRFIAGS